MRRRPRHRVHVRLGDVLDRHRNVVVPCPERLVVRRGHEAPALVDEGDGVDGREMVVCDV